jgi:hypothetical protein|tara:strand:+ start:419 stop:634 length:216 start_codon:yes stop_codon:yes gene_type:complete
MRELNKEEIKELGTIWPLIKNGRAPSLEVKSIVIKFWNKVAGTNFKPNSSCQACLGTVFYGTEGLYKEYFK